MPPKNVAAAKAKPSPKPAATKAKGATTTKAQTQPAGGTKGKTESGATGEKKAEPAPVMRLGTTIEFKQLARVLFEDEGNKIKDSGRWPLLIDENGQATTFLRYRDTNILTAMTATDMIPETMRKALLGALRYGKPLVLDLMESDMFDTCSERFDEIFPGLMSCIMDKSIMKEENYGKLIKDGDGDEYKLYLFNDEIMENFRFIIISSKLQPPASLLDQTYVVRLNVPT
ncbi:hypothetical protein ScPMuIL_006892 [Solemya velum]